MWSCDGQGCINLWCDISVIPLCGAIAAGVQVVKDVNPTEYAVLCGNYKAARLLLALSTSTMEEHRYSSKNSLFATAVLKHMMLTKQPIF